MAKMSADRARLLERYSRLAACIFTFNILHYVAKVSFLRAAVIAMILLIALHIVCFVADEIIFRWRHKDEA